MKSRVATPWLKAIALGALGSLFVALLVLAFSWPTKTVSAEDVPIGIAGPEAAVTAVGDALEDNAEGVFELVDASTRAEAIAQIEARETFGAIVLPDGAGAPEILTAPAAGTATVEMLNGVAAELQAQLDQQVAAQGAGIDAPEVSVTEIVPLSEDDPSGSGLAAAAFPMTLGGIVGGSLICLLVAGPLRRLGALVGFGASAGIILALVLDGGFGFLQGEFWLNTLALGLSVTATSSLIIGLSSLIGTAGLGVAAATTMLVANPLSAAAVPWQFLASPWGAIGQYMVPGASNTLVRTLSYFPEADASRQWLTLVAWVAAGVVFTLLALLRKRSAPAAPAENPEFASESPSPGTSQVSPVLLTAPSEDAPGNGDREREDRERVTHEAALTR